MNTLNRTACRARFSASLATANPAALHERTMLLTLQNGLANEEFLAEHFGEERVLKSLNENVNKIDNLHEEQFKICGASENQGAQSSKNCSC